MHVHVGTSKDGASLSWSGLQKVLEEYPLSHAVVFPVDEPHPGPSYARLNEKISKMAARDKRIIGFLRLDPCQPEAAHKELKRGRALGLRGVKLHPRSENFSPAQAEDLIAAIEKERFPVVLHTSHERHSHPSTWESMFVKFKKISFILAHAGKDAYLEARRLAVKYPHVYLDTSTLSYRRTAVLLEKPGPEKIVFASDLPYSHPAIELLKFDLILKANRVSKRKIFEENPKRILGGLS